MRLIGAFFVYSAVFMLVIFAVALLLSVPKSKSIGDVGWSMFVNATRCKAEEAGSKVVLVNPKGTSQTCSRCGLTVKKGLSERMHRCECGLVVDRDLNASINILRLGLQSLSQTGIEAHAL